MRNAPSNRTHHTPSRRGYEVNVYCDESRHTSDPSQPYMVIGAISCPRDHKRRVVHQIHSLKARFDAQGEFGWKRLSPNRREFYWALIDLFAGDPALEFRALVCNRNHLDHDTYNHGDGELGFYKLYYQMLVHWLKPQCTYYIYLDWQQNRAQHRFRDLKHILARRLTGRARLHRERELPPERGRTRPILFVSMAIYSDPVAANKIDPPSIG